MDPFEPGVGLPPRRDAGTMRLGGSCRARAALRRRRAGGAFCQRRWRREFSRGGGSAPTPLAPSMATGRDRPCAALHRFRSHRRASPLGRHLFGRRVYTEDGGETWSPRNSGTRCDFLPEGERYPEFGQCVHNLTLAPGCSDRLYQQNHCGMYRSDDGGASWRSIENGLPSSFGFPVAAHPRDADTLFFLPLNGDTKGRYPPDARAAVWRSRDGGAHWADGRAGLPQSGAYFGVMRQALATDALDPAGVYFGTSNGSVYASRDEGETWECIARDLPAISSVETMTAA